MLAKFLVIFCSVITLNLLVLNVAIIKMMPQKQSEEQVLAVTSKSNTSVCPTACLDKIAKVQKSITATAVAAKSTTESFVPIGSGTGNSDVWTDVPGLQVEIDTAKYGKIQKANFEASVYVPNSNQNVEVRLYNVTDSHPVWYSDLSFSNAGTAQTQTSGAISLESGQKAYKVQMKTQLKFTTNVTSSRIRIISQ